MKKFLSALYAFILTVFGLVAPGEDLLPIAPREGVPTEENIALFREIYETEIEWLASLQLDNGAIPMTPVKNGEVRMNPYFADFAALALLDEADEYADEVKAYMEWHFDHLNTAETDYNGVDGTIYDYLITVKDGKAAGETIAMYKRNYSYDSTDSYAATFLSVLNKYYEKTGDGEYIIAHAEEIERIINALFATFHKGLTYAKPDWRVKYLMDNCEVYEGLLAASELYNKVLSDRDEAYKVTEDKCSGAAVEVADTIESQLWLPALGHYQVGAWKIIGTTSDIFSWKKYYPCATAQLFPIIHGLIAPNTERANMLYDKFCESYNWESFEYDDVFYWGANLQAAVMMNDIDRVVTYMTNYAELTDDHAYPLYNADAARVCLAMNMLLEKYGSQ